MKCPVCGSDGEFHLILSKPERLDIYPQGLHCQQCGYVIVQEHGPSKENDRMDEKE